MQQQIWSFAEVVQDLYMKYVRMVLSAIAIPKANLPGDHQAANARSLERLDVLRVLYERVNWHLEML